MNKNESTVDIKSKVTKGLFWTYAEKLSSQVVSLVISIILARKIAPEDYGAIAIVLVFITLANTLVTGGFGNSLIQKKQADDIDFSTVFHFSIGFSFLLGVVLYVTAPLIAYYYDMDILTRIFRVMIIQLPFASIVSVQQAYVSKNMLFRNSFYSTLIGTVISAIVGLVMAYGGYGIWALVFQSITNVIVNAIVLFFTLKWTPKFVFSISRMKGLFSFGWKMLLTSLLFSLYSQLQQLIIGKKYSTEDLAYCNKGAQFPNLITNNINVTISKVFFPVLAEEQNNHERLLSMTRRAIKTGTYIISPILLGLIVVAAPFISVILTDKWLPCVPYLQIYCLIYLLQPIQTASIQAINAVGRSDIYLKLEIVKKIVGIGSLIVAIFCFQNVFAIMIASLISEIFATVLNAPVNKKMFQYRYKDQILDIIPGLVLSSGMAFIVYFIKYLPIHQVCILALQVIIGGFIYMFLGKIFKVESQSYVLQIVKGIFQKYTSRNNSK